MRNIVPVKIVFLCGTVPLPFTQNRSLTAEVNQRSILIIDDEDDIATMAKEIYITSFRFHTPCFVPTKIVLSERAMDDIDRLGRSDV